MTNELLRNAVDHLTSERTSMGIGAGTVGLSFAHVMDVIDPLISAFGVAIGIVLTVILIRINLSRWQLERKKLQLEIAQLEGEL